MQFWRCLATKTSINVSPEILTRQMKVLSDGVCLNSVDTKIQLLCNFSKPWFYQHSELFEGKSEFVFCLEYKKAIIGNQCIVLIQRWPPPFMGLSEIEAPPTILHFPENNNEFHFHFHFIQSDVFQSF